MTRTDLWQLALVVVIGLVVTYPIAQWLDRDEQDWRAREWRRQYNAQIVRDAGTDAPVLSEPCKLRGKLHSVVPSIQLCPEDRP